MLNIIQCKLCDKPFNSFGSFICPDCLEKLDEDFLKIRDYIYDNPGKTNVDQIAEATEIDAKIILHLLEEGRLSTTGLSHLGLTCQICGKPIASGKMCDDCRGSLSRQLDSVLPPPPAKPDPKTFGKPGAKMHVDHNKR